MTTRKQIEAEATDADKEEAGRRIKQARERHRWTLDELSQATKQIDPQQQGVSKVSISRYENADTYPGYREIKLIAQALGEPVTYFFYGERPDPYSGWTMSLDEYLRHIIKDVLIEEGVLPGVSIADKEQQKSDAQYAVNSRRRRLDSAPDPERGRALQAEILERAATLDKTLAAPAAKRKPRA